MHSKMSQQLGTGSPDKQALASVLSYLKDKQLKETEQALKRELGLEGASSQMDTSVSHQLPPVPQSDTEPAKYQESYSRPAPASSPSTATDLQPAYHRQTDNLETTTEREPLSSLESNDSDDEEDEEVYEEDEEVYEEEEEEGEGDISDPIPSPSDETKQRPVSWPGSLPNHHLLKFPTPNQIMLSSTDRTHIRAQYTTTTALPPFTCNPTVPLWAVGSSALRPMSVTSSPSSTSLTLSASSTVAPLTSPNPSVIYSMLSSHSIGQLRQQPLLTPLLTIVPSAALVSTAASSNAQPLIIGPHRKPSSLPTLSQSMRSRTSVSSSAGSITPVISPRLSLAEPSTGQTICSPVTEPTRALCHVPPQRTLASIPPSEMTPQYIELKTFAEEFKTKRIRLGYTQGSVGQSLARKGYSNFAQSTISRFEQMQLSATNAAAIKQVLEKWLQETEFPESVTTNTSDTPMMASRKRKKRAVFTPQTKSTLDNFFHQNPRPNRQAIESMAQQLDLLPEEVRVWFCNKRQKQKQSSTSSTSSYYSAVSPASSGGYISLRSPSLSPKHRSPSPKTNFTIEELSKSSNNSSASTSPVLLTSPFSISPTTISLSATTGGVFPLIMPTTTLPHNMTITQTRA